jgi:hypothetical protein
LVPSVVLALEIMLTDIQCQDNIYALANATQLNNNVA